METYSSNLSKEEFRYYKTLSHKLVEINKKKLLPKI